MKKRGLMLVIGMFLIMVVEVSAGDISSCQILSTNGETYNLTEDLYAELDSHCLQITGDNIIVEGNGFYVRGNQSNSASNKWGVYVTGSNVTVNNVRFQNWTYTLNYAGFIVDSDFKLKNSVIESDSKYFQFGVNSHNSYVENVTTLGATDIRWIQETNNRTINNSNFRLRLIDLTSKGFTKIYNSNLSTNINNNLEGSVLEIIDSNLSSTIKFYNGSSTVLKGNTFQENENFIIHSNNTLIENNTLMNSQLRIGNSASYTNNITFRNNNAYDTPVGGIYTNYIYNFRAYNNFGQDVQVHFSPYYSYNGLIYNNTYNNTQDISSGHGIMVNYESYNVSVYNNVLKNQDFGLLFEWGAYNNIFYDNYVYNSSIGIYSLHDTHDNIAYNNYLEGDMSLLDNVTNEFFYNNTINGSLKFQTDNDIGDGTGAIGNIIQDTIITVSIGFFGNSSNTLINVSNVRENFYYTNNNLTRKWYLSASSNVNNTNITITNSTRDIVYSGVVNGSIPQQTLLSYINEGGTQTNYSNYTITASATGYVTNTTEINLTENKNISFSLTAVASGTGEDTTSSGGLPNFYPTESDLKEGFSKQLGVNWNVNFKSNNKNHNLKVNKIDNKNKTATIMVSPNPQTKTLSIGEGWRVNLNEDDYYDIYVKLNNLTLIRAEIYIKTINESISSENNGDVKDYLDNKESVNPPKRTNYWTYSAVIILILISCFLFIFFISRKKRKKKY